MGEGAEREGGECGRRKRIGAMEQDEEEDVGEGAERGGGGCWRRSKRRMRTWEKEQKEEQVVGVGGDHGRSRRKGGRGTGQEKKSCVFKCAFVPLSMQNIFFENRWKQVSDQFRKQAVKKALNSSPPLYSSP